MSVTIKGLKELEQNLKKRQKEIEKGAKKAIRKALTEGAKELKKAIRPHIPVLDSSTNFRQKGTVRNNLRHRVKMSRDSLSGIAIVRIRRAGKKRMARIGENTQDRTDPFYWFMLNNGTSKMQGQHFLEKGAAAGKDRALRKAKQVLKDEIRAIVKKQP